MSEHTSTDGHFAIALAVVILAGLTCVAGSTIAGRINAHASAVSAIAEEMRLDREAMEKCAARGPDERASQGAKDEEAGQ